VIGAGFPLAEAEWQDQLLNQLGTVAVLGATDLTLFIWPRRRTLFRSSPGRAGGSAAGLILWSALAAACLPNRSSTRSRLRSWLIIALGLVCGTGNLGLAGIHFKIGKGRARSLPGAVLGACCLSRIGSLLLSGFGGPISST
jgi:hypothetical protein